MKLKCYEYEEITSQTSERLLIKRKIGVNLSTFKIEMSVHQKIQLKMKRHLRMGENT